MRSLLTFIIGLFFTSLSYGQVVIADALPGCLDIPVTVGMSCGGGGSLFGINGSGQFEVNNIDGEFCCTAGTAEGGDFNSYFEFDPIDISCFSEVEWTFDYSSFYPPSGSPFENNSSTPIFGCSGTPVDNGHDQIVFFYSVDSGPFVQSLYVNGVTVADFTGTWSEGPVNGSTLTIRVYASNKASAEHFYFENLVVTADAPVLDAGPDETYCDLNPVNLAATGVGTWSGGAGTFSDVNSPTSTYTPDASEDNSTVTLTYSSCTATAACSSDYPPVQDMVDLTFASLLANPFNIMDCESNVTNYDLTQHNTTVNNTETVTWYDGDPLLGGGTQILPDNDVDLNGITDLWALVDNGICQVSVNIGLILDPSPSITDPLIDYCTGSFIDLTLFNTTVNNTETVEWYDGDPNNGGSLINPDNNVDLTGVDLWVLVTNASSCSAALQVTVNNSPTPTVSFGGDVDICQGECSDFGNSLSFIFADGVAPYTLQMEIVIGGVPFPFVAVGLNGGDKIVICSQGNFPNFSTSPSTLTIPQALTGSFTMNLLNATDANGCPAIIGVDAINIIVNPIPTVADPGLLDDCASVYDAFDLTAYDFVVNGLGNVMWYDGDPNNGGTPINNPSSADLNPMPDLWVSVTDPITSCVSTLNVIDPTLFDSPEISFNTTSEDLCSGECVLLNISISGGTPPYTVGFDSQVSLSGVPNNYVFDLDFNSGEFDMEVCLQGTLASQSENDATNTLIIPTTAIANGIGQIGINYILDDNNCGGIVNTPNTVDLTFNAGPDAFDASLTICDLDNDGVEIFNLQDADNDINGNTGFNVLYFTDLAGTIPISSPSNFVGNDGQVIYAQVEDLGCLSTIIALTLNLEEPLLFDPPADITVCQQFTLPGINYLSGTPINASYSDAPLGGSGTTLAAGDVVTLGGTYYLYDNSYGLCQNNPSFELTIDPPLSAGVDVPTLVCENSIVDLASLLSGADFGGYFLDASNVPVADPNNVSTIGLAAGTVLTFTYNVDNIAPCPTDIATIELTIASGVSAGTNMDVNICTGASIDLNTVLSTTADLGGTFNDDDLSGGLTGTMFNSSGLPLGMYHFTYTIGGGSCPVSMAVMTINVQAGPNLDPIADVEACGGIFTLLNISGTNLSGNEAYYDMPNGMGTMFMPGDNISSSMTIYAFDQSNNCFDEESFYVDVLMQLNAGNDNVIEPCTNFTGLFDLTSLLSNDADLGGIWVEISTTGIDLSNPLAVEIATYSGTNIELEYQVGNGACTDQATFNINWINAPIVGTDYNENICNDVNDFNLDASIGVHDPNGNWKQTTGSPIDLANDNSIDFTDLDAGVYVFEYTIDANEFCEEATSIVTMNLSSNPTATVINGNACTGSPIDLHDFVLMDDSGEFVDMATNAIVPLGVFDPGTSVGDFDFQYTLTDPSGICPPFVATFIVSVDNGVFAGTDIPSYTVCAGSDVNLYDILIDADQGGDFLIINGEGTINGSTYSAVDNPSNSAVMIEYSIGDDIICDKDIATIELNITSLPEIMLQPLDNNICPESCADFVVLISGTPPVQYVLRFSSTNGESISLNFTPVTQQQTITLCNDAGVLMIDNVEPLGTATGTWQVEVVSYEDGNCSVDNSNEMFNFDPNAGEIMELIDSQLCSDQSITINGQVYDIDRPKGIEMVNNADGCDTIYDIQLQFYPVTSNNILGTYCTDYSIMVGPDTYDINNTSGITILTNMSSNGCDSMVVVELQFHAEAIGFVNSIYCADEEVIIEGQIFNINNPMGEVVIPSGSINACDSIVMVDLEFVNETIYNVMSAECADYQININGIVYDDNNPIGSDTLIGGNYRGCDSIINVNLSFFPIATGDYTEVLCMGEEIELNGVIFNENNPQGILTIPNATNNGCDSILYVNIFYTGLTASVSIAEVEEGTSYQMSLEIDGAYNSIEWSPSIGLSCTDCDNPIAMPLETTLYTATINYGNDCIVELTQQIVIEVDVPSVYIPNIFSPNGDGVNDDFRIYLSDENMIIANFEIYDRWGELIYKGDGLSLFDNYIYWDGSFKGEDAIDGVYTYLIQIGSVGSDELVNYKGDITLLR